MATLQDDGAALIFGVRRRIGFVVPDVVIEESGKDELTITQHPVEKGSPISDHAFKNPVRVDMQCGFSDSRGGVGWSREAYEALLELQYMREPFSVTTGKRTYSNMLVRGIAASTDQRTEHALMATVSLEEVIIVSTSSTSSADQKSPQSTAPSQNEGPRQLQSAGLVGPAGGTAPT